MCGIVGVVSNTPINHREWLTVGRDAMTHRGPDDAGHWWSDDGRVGMGHRRLAILDLSPLGHQPMHKPELGLSVVFNGEIYNFAELRKELKQYGFVFHSQSDTEVLMAAYAHWGTDCVDRLNGMFALAIFDAPRQRLFLARDRAGEKPLFYHFDKGALHFASELKALMANPALPRQVDPDALDCYLAMGFVPGEGCLLRGFRKLPAAHAMVFDVARGSAALWRYWQLPDLSESADQADECALLDELDALLEDAVTRQMVADVPVGILLSGGVDSSLVTAMAVRRSSDVRTFSIGFPGHGRLDETPHARLIARHFGTRHVELMAEPVGADLITRLVRQFDEPIVDSSMIPTWQVSHLVRQHCAVALGGDGGDELFGGYSHYSRLLALRSHLSWLPLSVRRLVARGASTLLPMGFKGRNWLQIAGSDLAGGLPMVANYFDATWRRKLLGTRCTSDGIAEEVFSERVPPGADLVQRATRMDFSNYLAEDILVKVDRASMLNSLELRAPMLDRRLVEFAYRQVPSRLKAGVHERKILLKKLCERLLPPEFDRQRKQGFSIPMSAWLKQGPMRDLFWGVLLDAQTMFDRRAVKALLEGQDRGRANGERLFALLQLELWRREYGVAL
jgi:asparagine synthase (glutamine-hydrolysing)